MIKEILLILSVAMGVQEMLLHSKCQTSSCALFFGPTMYILSCSAIIALLFRISNLVLPRVRRNATAVLLNGVKYNKSLFIISFKLNMRKRARLDVSGATSTTIAEPYLRIIKTSSSVEKMVGF